MNAAHGAAPRVLPATSPVRAGLAFGALLAGWLSAGAVAVLFERGVMNDGGGDPSLLGGFVLFIGLFAAAGWLITVLPLALFGRHDGSFYHPALAPLIGAVSGVLLLLLELWIFFAAPPWEMVGPGANVGDAYLMALGGIVGAVTWSAYTVAIRRWGRPAAR